MTTFYTFNTLNDPDQGTSTDIRPFGQFYAPTSVASQCYNALFGKGNYDGCDPNLAVNFELQDNTNTNIVLDSSDNGRNGELKNRYNVSHGNTEDLSYENGPTGYLPRSLKPPSAAGGYEAAAIKFTSNHNTVVDWGDVPEAQGMTVVGWTNMGPITPPYQSRANPKFLYRLRNGNALAGAWSYAGVHDQANAGWTRAIIGSYPSGFQDTNSPRLDPERWYHFSYTFKDLNRTIFIDGEETFTAVSASSLDPYPTTGTLSFVGDSLGKSYFAGVAMFDRELSDTEIAEAYSGPEPYAQSMPSITGTPTVGEFVTINAGVWNSQNNGSIRYTYKMYSYSDTNGTDQRLEKEVTSYLTAQKILIRGSRLVGRYLSFEISAENDGGTDPLEVYNTGYTAAIGSGTDPTYVSYNALFGYGKHVPDPELQTRMLFDSDPTLEEFQQYGDWTVNNVALTSSNLVDVGPTSYLTQSFYQSVVGQNITFSSPNSNLTSTAYTAGSWVKLDAYEPVGVSSAITMANHSGNYIGLRVFGNAYFSAGAVAPVSFSWGNDVGLGNWGHIVGRLDTTGFEQPSTAEVYLNSESKNSLSSSGWWHLAPTSGEIMHRIPGNMADFWWIQRALSDDEIAETYTGPEPVNITPATISGDFRVGFTISVNAGVWDSQNNGTITKTYQWYRADDANGTNLTAIPGETGSTYALSFDDHQKYVTVKERASNDGGYDELEDTYATYTSEIGLKGGMLIVKAG